MVTCLHGVKRNEGCILILRFVLAESRLLHSVIDGRILFLLGFRC